MLPLLVVRGTIPLGSVDIHFLSIECNVNNIYVYTYEHLGNELCYSFITLSFIAKGRFQKFLLNRLVE